MNTTNDLNTIGKRIRHRLVVLEKNQTWLAETIGYGPERRTTISNWCKDQSDIHVHSIVSVARALGCSVEWLLTGADGDGVSQRRQQS